MFDNGYHTVHHEQPGVHWSRYRELHQQGAAAIDPELNQDFIIGYALKRYWLGAARRVTLGAGDT